MKTIYNESNELANGKDKWERVDAGELVSAFETRDQTISQRDFAKMADVPRSTLRYWLARKNSIVPALKGGTHNLLCGTKGFIN